MAVFSGLVRPCKGRSAPKPGAVALVVMVVVAVCGSATLVALAQTPPPPSASPVRTVRVAALSCRDAEHSRDVLAGFRQTLEAEGYAVALETASVDEDAASAAALIDRAKNGAFDVVLALGPAAASAASQIPPPIPVLVGLARQPFESPAGPNVTSVVVDFSVETELRYLHLLLPHCPRVGVLYSPAHNQARIDAALLAAKQLGIELHARPVNSPREIPSALSSLAQEVDALWGVSDPVVLTPQTARPILLFSLRRLIPFVGPSGTWVEAGALYAVERDYADVGAQYAEFAVRALRGQAPLTPGAESPRRVVSWINARTAKRLHLAVNLPRDKRVFHVVD